MKGLELTIALEQVSVAWARVQNRCVASVPADGAVTQSDSGDAQQPDGAEAEERPGSGGFIFGADRSGKLRGRVDERVGLHPEFSGERRAIEFADEDRCHR